MELATIDRLLREKAHLDYIVELLKDGKTNEAIKILEKDSENIDKALQSK